jgi:hypothetical protein
VSADRVHARAGGAEARRAKQALVADAVSACLLFAGFVLGVVLGGSAERRDADGRVQRELAQGVCLDVQGRTVVCDARGAIFVVLGPRDMRSCPRSSPTVVKSIEATGAARRELSRWCVGINSRDR